MVLDNKKILGHSEKVLRQLCIFILYLIFVYWATQAVLKHLDEPTITNNYYIFGTDGKQLKPSVMTICSANKLIEHEFIFREECGIQFSIESGKFSFNKVYHKTYAFKHIFEYYFE